ncbi:hemerythrin domain-containing protein [Jiella sp. CQZ9-1]|uniref:Hemerythrin domain-containing protein n=2 Tax=Jiella flava TaxID=2816857 RepID=A0A939FXA4_9HYPH|nr:hemerythrin domain-containing protein [Jiella flava]
MVSALTGAIGSDEPTDRLQRHDIQDALRQQLSLQRRLCSALEEIADALPDNLNTQGALHVARLIGPTIRRAHAFEEETIFPLLTQHFSAHPDLRATLERLHFEHWEDESFADELADKLADYIRHRPSQNAEALGYMLRGFFEGLRRHIAFESEHVMPLLARIG